MTRRGMSLLEVVVAGVMLATLTTLCLEMLAATAARHRTLVQRQTALREAANVMERIAARSWDELTPGAGAGAQLSQPAQQQLPGGKLEIEITRPDGQSDAKRITVAVRWQDTSGEPAAHVQLVSWRYP